jgi:hypothetical protein
MNEAGVGRILVASLHQGIADLMPTRLEFYENWLHPMGLRDGSIGLAPLGAVLSFLRQEGEPYALVTTRAGECAAEWTFAGLSPVERALIRSCPVWLRARICLRLVRRIVRGSYRGSRAIVRLRKGEGTVDIRGSIFCGVREPVDRPLCGYYAAASTRLLALCGLQGRAAVQLCRGAGDSSCILSLAVHGSSAHDERFH